jgi:hypothetical protein
MDGGLLAKTFTEQFPEGLFEPSTITTLILDRIEQLNAAKEQTIALQF